MKVLKKILILILILLNVNFILYLMFGYSVQANNDDITKNYIGNYKDYSKIKTNKQDDIDEEYDKYTEEYKRYLALSDEEKSKVNVIPPKYKIPLESLYEKEDVSNSSNLRKSKKRIQSIPEKFDLRDKIEIPTRNQGNLGLCWDFASIKSLETYLALNGYGNYDLSELHLAYLTDPTLNIANWGGNYSDFENYLTNEWGPVLESEVPYDSRYSTDNFEYLLNLKKDIFVGDTVNFPNIDKAHNEYTSEQLNIFRNKVKEHIMKNGSLYCSICTTEEDGSNVIQKYNNHFVLNYHGNHYADHAISIIGWDDKFSKENFPEECRPKEDGAYIAINSWGENWGEKGIFYISYEDIYVESDLCGIVNASTNINDILETVQFEDFNLYNELKEKLGKKVYKYNDETLTLYTSKLSLKSIYKLYLNNKNICSLKGLENFTNLIEIDLSNNNIENIELFKNLKNEYMRIYLGNNKIKDVSPLSNFYKIDISGNPIETGLDKLINVTSLSIGSCELSDSQIEQITKLPLLNELSLQNDNIKNVSFFENLSSIESLNLSENKEIANINKLIHVKNLILQDCNLDNSIVNELKNLNTLNSLDLSNNNINDASIFQDLYNLTSLNLSYTNISDVSSLSEIRELYLNGNNNLTNLDRLYGVYNLELKDCNLTNFSFIDSLYYLREIDLSNNKLSNIPDFSKSNCSYIKLNHNNIKDISEIESLMNSNLLSIDLDLSNNLIETLPQFSNNNLWIDFSDNYISEASASTKRIYINQKLYGNYEVEFNTDNRIPLPQILKQDCQSIYSYQFEFITENCTLDYKRGEVIINPAKLGKGKASITLKTDSVYSISNGTTFNINFETKDNNLINNSKYDINGSYIMGIAPNTTTENMNLQLNYNLKFILINQGEQITDGIIKTGIIAKIIKNEEIIGEYTLVVNGDTNGDGNVDIKDILSMNKHRLDKSKLKNEYFKAGDINEDGTVDIKDILQVNKFRLEKVDSL